MDEKMRILNMLEAGKITSSEAAELLGALSRTDGPAPPPDEAPRSNSGSAEPPRDTKGASPSIGLDSITNEVRGRFGALAKELEPKLVGFAATMAEKTAEFADKVAKSASDATAEAPSPAAPRPTPHPRPTPGTKDTERSYDIHIPPSCKELYLHAHNALLVVRGYNGDKLTAKLRFRTSLPGIEPTLSVNEASCNLSYDTASFEYVSIDAYVPSEAFERVRLSAANGELRLSSLELGHIHAECSNAAMTLSDISADTGRFENSNGAIQAQNLDIQNLRLDTSNAPITLNIQDYRHSSYQWVVDTSNARVFVGLPMGRAAYSIKAATVLGHVNMGLSGLSYSLNTPTSIEAKTPGYETTAKRVSLTIQTTNGDIVINP